MTRKDYKLIAECIRESVEHMQDEWKYSPEMQDHMAVATAVIIRHLQNGLQQENSNFNAETFYKACAK